MYSNKKLVISGNKVELYVFEKEILYGKGTNSNKKRNKSPIEKTEEEKVAIRERSAWHSKRELQRLINANVGVWKDEKGRVYMLFFLTLTFAENMQDFKKANHEYGKFIQRINYEIMDKKKGKYLEYVCVPEFQKDIDHHGNIKPNGGSIHYHIVIFNLPFMKNVYDRLEQLWHKGYFNLKKISSIKNVGFYVTKYMTKDIVNIKMKQKKKYFSSRGLKKSKTIRKKTDVDFFMGFIPKNAEVSKKEHDLKFGGKFTHTIYDLSKDEDSRKSLLALSDIIRLK